MTAKVCTSYVTSGPEGSAMSVGSSSPASRCAAAPAHTSRWTTPSCAVDSGLDTVTGPRRLSFSPDSTRIATAGWTGAAVRQAENGRLVHRLPVHRTVIDLDHSPDGTHLVAAVGNHRSDQPTWMILLVLPLSGFLQEWGKELAQHACSEYARALATDVDYLLD
ncbi:hypothetical protein OH768_16520 [Streptomyces sp. NBC_01622]|uniref:hypothetical protein n=1 Tax=Streptomyces sp. NBC_01622 TaxID=2975903 RepID=UPI00386CB14D|nr:hypothetical protein OH768_16520 [Streptomyces sp. NBC_01622]